jgi:hypothetical protein
LALVSENGTKRRRPSQIRVPGDQFGRTLNLLRMLDMLLLAIAILALFAFILFAIAKPKSISKRSVIAVLSVNMLLIVFLTLNIGFEKLSSHILRVISNSTPKESDEIYSVLFGKPNDSCVVIVNIKDQLIPKIDCCIWMELKLCSSEVDRILISRKYENSTYHLRDTTMLLKSFVGRPDWWDLELAGDSIVKSFIRFKNNNQQTLFFGKDRSRVYVCDQAL